MVDIYVNDAKCLVSTKYLPMFKEKFSICSNLLTIKSLQFAKSLPNAKSLASTKSLVIDKYLIDENLSYMTEMSPSINFGK